MKKIKHFFQRLFYSLPFAMKGGEMFINNSKDNIGSSIQHVINESTLAEDLLRGEVTQQVEELRYQTYVVAEEAKNYKYIGEGIAIKDNKNLRTSRISFKQENKFNVRGILEELARVGVEEYGKETYTLQVKHEYTPRFQVERYCSSFELDINPKHDDNKADMFTLFFDNIPNVNEVTSKSFINELEGMVNGRRSDLSAIKSVEFITFNVYGENDLIRYTLKDLKMVSIKKTSNEYVLSYVINSYDREDLTSKYFSQSMADKYARKESKNTTFQGMQTQEKKYCAECGAEINKYDYAITLETVGKPLCEKCLHNHLQVQ